jgi:hypothetical protein
VSLTADHRHSVEDSAISVCLTRQTGKSVSVALDLEAFELSIYDRYINPRVAHEDA